MTLLRCAGIVLLGLLVMPLAEPVSAASATPAPSSVETKPAVKKAAPAAAVKKPAQAAAKRGTAEKTKAKSATAKGKAAKSSSRKQSDSIAAPLPGIKLDLSLPPEMVRRMRPEGQAEPEVSRPLLPALFDEKPATDSPFQLNGRLLSNEMQLQLRNDSRQDIEGAAIDFEFKQ